VAAISMPKIPAVERRTERVMMCTWGEWGGVAFGRGALSNERSMY
jgi:hypothetical protein